MSRPAAVPGARATLFLSLSMSLIGIGGIAGSYGMLTIPPSELQPVELVPGTASATSAMLAAMAASPLMKAITVGNLLASGLLVVASVLLSVRRTTAIWWARQAILANVLYTVAYAAGSVWFGQQHPELVEAMLVTSSGQPLPEGTPTLLGYAVGTSCGSVIMLGVYALMARTIGRADVRGFVRREVTE